VPRAPLGGLDLEGGVPGNRALMTSVSFTKKAAYVLLKAQSKIGKRFGASEGLKIPIHSRTWRFLFKEIFLKEIYFFRSERPDPVIIDGGGNIGFAILYFKRLYPQAKILSFEASEETHKKLMETLKENHLSDVRIEKYALSDEAGLKVRFYKNSVDGCDLGASLNSRGLGSFEEVETRKLSDYITEPVDYLKLDIEGGETGVFRDLVQSEKLSFITQGLIEFHMSEKNPGNDLAFILKALKDEGFTYRFMDCERPDDSWEGQQLLLIAFRKSH